MPLPYVVYVEEVAKWQLAAVYLTSRRNEFPESASVKMTDAGLANRQIPSDSSSDAVYRRQYALNAVV